MLISIPRLARALLSAALLLLLVSVSSAATGLSDIRVSEDDGEIVIHYDLAQPSDGLKYEYDISLSAIFTDSTKHEIIPRSIHGDYGPGLSPGRNRRISWPILSDAGDYLNGDLEVRLDAKVNRWQWSEGDGRPGVQLGFEIMSDMRFEMDQKMASDQGEDFDARFVSEDFAFEDNKMYRLFLSFPQDATSWEAGLSYGYHRSPKVCVDYEDYSIGEVKYFVVDGRLVLGALWFGVGVGNHVLGERFDYEGVTREDWNPEYWYYEVGCGLRLGLGPLGALGVDVRAGTQKVAEWHWEGPWYDETVTFRTNVISVRVGYSIKLGDFLSLFAGGGKWEPLPATRLTGRGTLTGLALGKARREPPQTQPPVSFPQVAGLSFAYIPSGSYWVGTAPEEPARDPLFEPGLFLLSKTAFFISTTEVPQQTYQIYVDRQWEHHKGPDYPAHSVSYDEAVEFCNRLTAQDPAFVYSLPTEGEWEIACRGALHPEEGPIAAVNPADRRKCRQNLDSCDYVLKQHAWFLSNKIGSGAFPVGLKRPNVIGLYDMLGNVAEWCMREEGVPAWQSSVEAGREPLRGGSILSDLSRCRAGARAWEPRDTKKPSIGFRIVCRPKEGN